MFKTQEELKEFLLWAKQEKVVRVKIADIEVEFSGLALIEEANLNTATEPKSGEELKPQETDKEDEMLYWSTSN